MKLFILSANILLVACSPAEKQYSVDELFKDKQLLKTTIEWCIKDLPFRAKTTNCLNADTATEKTWKCKEFKGKACE